MSRNHRDISDKWQHAVNRQHNAAARAMEMAKRSVTDACPKIANNGNGQKQALHSQHECRRCASLQVSIMPLKYPATRPSKMPITKRTR